MNSKRRIRGSGQPLTAQRCKDQNATITETTPLIVCQGREEEEEVDSQAMAADLQGQVCEPQSADFTMMGEVSQLLAHTDLNKLVRWEVESKGASCLLLAVTSDSLL